MWGLAKRMQSISSVWWQWQGHKHCPPLPAHSRSCDCRANHPAAKLTGKLAEKHSSFLTFISDVSTSDGSSWYGCQTRHAIAAISYYLTARSSAQTLSTQIIHQVHWAYLDAKIDGYIHKDIWKQGKYLTEITELKEIIDNGNMREGR